MGERLWLKQTCAETAFIGPSARLSTVSPISHDPVVDRLHTGRYAAGRLAEHVRHRTVAVFKAVVRQRPLLPDLVVMIVLRQGGRREAVLSRPRYALRNPQQAPAVLEPRVSDPEYLLVQVAGAPIRGHAVAVRRAALGPQLDKRRAKREAVVRAHGRPPSRTAASPARLPGRDAGARAPTRSPTHYSLRSGAARHRRVPRHMGRREPPGRRGRSTGPDLFPFP